MKSCLDYSIISWEWFGNIFVCFVYFVVKKLVGAVKPNTKLISLFFLKNSVLSVTPW